MLQKIVQKLTIIERPAWVTGLEMQMSIGLLLSSFSSADYS